MSNSSTSEFSCRDIHIFPYRGDPRGSGPGSRSTISEARQTFCRPQLLPPELYSRHCACPGTQPHPPLPGKGQQHNVYALSLSWPWPVQRLQCHHRVPRNSPIPKAGRPRNGHDNELTTWESQGQEDEPTMSSKVMLGTSGIPCNYLLTDTHHRLSARSDHPRPHSHT